MCQLFLAHDLQILCGSREVLSSLLGLHQKDAIASCSIISHHYSGPLHQVGDRLHDMQPSFGRGHKYIIFAVDYFTKWGEAMPTYKADGETAAFFIFNRIIARFAIPKEIVTDHGSHI